MEDISPDVVSAVQDSWERIKDSSPAWEDDFGDRFLKR
jgi:hypothetical protein